MYKKLSDMIGVGMNDVWMDDSVPKLLLLDESFDYKKDGRVENRGKSKRILENKEL